MGNAHSGEAWVLVEDSPVGSVDGGSGKTRVYEWEDMVRDVSRTVDVKVELDEAKAKLGKEHADLETLLEAGG